MDPNSNINQPPQVPQDPYYAPNEGGGIFANKKRILLIGLIIFAFLGLLIFLIWFIFMRGGSDADSQEATIVYWGVWEDAAVLQPVFDEFQRENPNIKVEYEKIDIKTLGDYVDRLKTRTSEGNGPDIMRFHSSWLLQIKDILAPFPEDVVTSTGLDKDYFTVVQRDLKRDGAYYGIPLSIDTLALYTNKDLLSNIGASPPTTWNDLDSLARELTVIEAGKITKSGVAMGTYDNIAHASDIVSLLFLQNGANFENLAGEDIESTINALTFYTLFTGNQNSAVWNQSQENSKIAFAGGNLAMYFGYSWDIFEIKAFNPNLNFKVDPVPLLPGAKSTIASYWAEGVSNKSEHPEAAFKLLKFLGKNESLQKIYEGQVKSRGYGSPYPKRSLAESVKNDNSVYPFTLRADDAISTFFSSDTYDSGLNDEMNIYLGNAVRSIINDNTSEESAVETLGKGVNQVLSRYE